MKNCRKKRGQHGRKTCKNKAFGIRLQRRFVGIKAKRNGKEKERHKNYFTVKHF